MAKNLTELIIFISCPSDLDPERKAIQSAIEELNPVLSEAHSVILRAVTWDKDLLPGIGPDVQSVINQQIESKYDIYIGVLGARFGTATPRALSGTEEEFEAAFKRYLTSPSTVRLLFYFKSSSTDIQHIDATQLSKVHSFRRKLGELGVLYKDFSNDQELLKLIRNHLGQIVLRDWQGKEWKASQKLREQEELRGAGGVTSAGSSTPDLESLTRPGIVDSMYIADFEMDNILQTLNRMKDAENSLWGSVQKSRAVSGQLKDGDIRGLKMLIDQMTDELAQYIEKMAAEGLLLKGHLRRFTDGMETTINLYFEESHGDPSFVKDAPANLASLINGLQSARENLKQFRQVL